MSKRIITLLYVLIDFALSFGVWVLFVIYRRVQIEQVERILEPQQFKNAAIIGIYWLILYLIAGLFDDPYRKSRLKELFQVYKSSLLGVLIIFFTFFIDDGNYMAYYQTLNYLKNFFIYFLLQSSAILIFHILLTTNTAIRIRKRKINFPTLLIGGGESAKQIFNDLNNRHRSLGYQFEGYVNAKNAPSPLFEGKLKRFGNLDAVDDIIRNRKIEEVIIALDKSESEYIGLVIEHCERTTVNIKVVPGTYDYLVGSVRSSHILGAPLIEISPQILTSWEIFFKRSFDIGFAIFALLFLSPIYFLIMVLVKWNDSGPAMYKQERIGRNGKPFFIYKFRSMYIDAEKAGPALSKDNDPRITPIGRLLRKFRLDELPQFWNVLIGDMSIVGPRPERQFFIDQIIKVAPHYRHLHKVRPGVTSWGQVKFGYASSVEEMVEKLKYDILYIENISLTLDIKIILYTVIVMIEGRGK